MILSPRRLIKIHLKNHKKAVECRNKYHGDISVNWFLILTISSSRIIFSVASSLSGGLKRWLRTNNGNLSTSMASAQIESELETTAKLFAAELSFFPSGAGRSQTTALQTKRIEKECQINLRAFSFSYFIAAQKKISWR